MKKTTIISGLLLSTLINAQTFAPNPGAQSGSVNTGFARGGSVIASDPSDLSTIGQDSIACRNNDKGAHADNSYWRFFDIDGLGEIEITDVDIGIQTAVGGGGGGTQPVVIRIYSIPNGGSLPTATLSLITESATTVSDIDTTVVNFPISANLDAATMDLVVEFHTPDATSNGNGELHNLFLGSNTSPEDNPLFLSSEACSLTSPTAVGDIGFPDMHGIMVVNGLANVPVELMNFSIE